MLLEHLDCGYELVDVGNVAQSGAERFGGNPLMNVPVLEHGEVVVYDSDHIAAYVVRGVARSDDFDVLTQDPVTLNARSLLNGAMAAEVRLVLAERTGLATAALPYFDKARLAIANVLTWLESRPALLSPSAPTYLLFHFVSFWDHVHHYGLVSGSWPTLRDIALECSRSELVSKTSPTAGVRG